MRRYIALMLLILAALPALLAQRVWKPQDLPVMQTRRAGDYVVNPEGVLSSTTVDSANRLLRQLEHDKGVQSLVVVVGHLAGDDPYEFGMDLGRRYGIGLKEQNTGLILIIATRDRSYQILTGQGLEGTLPDAICRRIENRIMVPRLKQADWDGAVLASLQSIDGYVRGDSTITAPRQREEQNDGSLFNSIVGFSLSIAFVLALLLTLGRRNQRICPVCHKGHLRPVNRRRLRVGGRWMLRTTWQCPRCGHREDHDEPESPPSSNGGMFVPPFFMGGSGGFGSSGGGSSFGGGSFGGGSFGGGGSGGRF